MSTITIADHQTDVILDDIASDFYWDDKHSKNLRNNKETFGFTTFADKSFSEFLAKRNRIIIPDEDGELIELSIMNTRKYRQSNGALLCDVRTSASFIDLKQAKIIRPHVTSALSAEAHAREALNGTEYEVGTIDFKGVRTFVFEEMTNPYAYLHRIASEFGLELHFRVESNGNMITRRYVDLIERVGSWNGREVTFGRDLEGIERIEDFSHIVTALIGIGPEREDGTRLEVLVENEEALQRWGRNNQHRIEIYEPMSDDPDMTESRLRTLTENELEKRINSQVQYIANIVDLANVVGLEHEKMRFGDTIRIKDLKFNPPLYLEARIHTVERSIKNLTRKTVVLGDYIEYAEEDVMAMLRTLQKEVNKKIGLGTLSEVTYTKPEIDEKDERGNQAADKIETDVGWVTPIESTTGAQEKANQAKDDANEYTDGIKQQIDTELLEKTDYEYVDGKLALKADSEVVQVINNTVEGLEQTTSNLLQSVADNVDALEAQGGRITTVETDLDEVEGQLSLALTDLSTLNGTVSQHGTQISANTEAIGLKASQSDLDTLSGDVSSISGQLTVMAGEIEAKADRQALETLESNVTTISNDLASLSVAYDGITADISSLETTTDGLSTDITNLNTDIQAVAGEVSTKVSAEYVTGAIADIEIGGRNLLLGTTNEETEFSFEGWNDVDNRFNVSNSGVREISKGGTFTVSVDITEHIIGENRVGVIIFLRKNGSQVSQHFSYSTFVNPLETGKVVYTVSLPESDIDEVIVNLRHDAGNASLSEGKFANLKLEKGNKATDWTPAPEDVQAEIDSVYQYASSEISQLSGRIDLKADSTVIEGIESRVTSVELSIDGLEGQITSKVEADDVRSIFTQEAGSFTFSANQINFDGHVFGQNATFEGKIVGAEIVGSTIIQQGIDGYIELTEDGLYLKSNVNDGVRIAIETHSDDLYFPSLLWFEPSVNMHKFAVGVNSSGLGDGVLGFTESSPNRWFNIYNWGSGSQVRFYTPTVTMLGRLHFDSSRINTSSIYWNATSSADYGMIINVDGSSVARLESDGTMSVNRFKPYSTQSFYVMATTEVRITDERGFNAGNTNYIPIRARSFEPPQSLREKKHNIDPFKDDTIDIIRNSNAYLFNYDFESADEKRTLGIMLDEVPSEIHSKSGTSVDLYSMSGYLWKGVKDLIERTDKHEDDINFLKMKNQYLEDKVEELERKIA